MTNKTVKELAEDMRGEVKWFRNAARKHSHNASKTVIATTRICELVEQEAHDRIADKLAEWVEKIEKAESSINVNN